MAHSRTDPTCPRNFNSSTISDASIDEIKAFVKAQRNIIDCKETFSTPLTKPLSRALANQRLVRVFGVNNGFTNIDDATYRYQFKLQSIDKMQVAIGLNPVKGGQQGKDEDVKGTGNWDGLRAAAHDAVTEFLSHSEEKISVVEFAQFVTLKVSLKYLFPTASALANPSPSSFQQIKYIGQRINALWLLSKDPADTTSWADQTQLHEALLAVTTTHGAWMHTIANALDYIPGVGMLFRWAVGVSKNEPHPLDPKRNPMNWLLPAYETMWRVVLHCVLEIGYRDADRGPVWRDVLSGFVSGGAEFRGRKKRGGDANAPVPEDVDRDGEEASDGDATHTLRALNITREILRLYPPVTHIHRRVDATSPEIVKADILRCQRNRLLSHNDPDVFRPERWIKIDRDIDQYLARTKSKNSHKEEEQERGFIPFAAVCPSDESKTKGFGMKMIALLTGVMLERLGGEWRLGQGLSAIGTALDSGRTAYEDLYLEKMEEAGGEREG